MKFIQKFTEEQFAKSAARFLKFVCYFVICAFVLFTVLSFMGRQTFSLHTSTESFPRAIYAEEDHDPLSRGVTVHMGDDIHVWAWDSGQINLTKHIGLSLMYAVKMVPMIFAFWFLSRLFSNIQGGQIFTEQNASCLLWFGLLEFSTAVFVPFLKLLICWLTNLASDNRISVATGQDMLSMLIPSIASVVAAYIIHYGVHLQDEVDHTL